MAANVIVDAGFLVALLSRRDSNHAFAAGAAADTPPPWQTCEAVLSEAFHLLGARNADRLAALIQRDALVCTFRFGSGADHVLRLMRKYTNVPMSFADACLVRMSEVLPDPLLLSTDRDFRIYRRNGRQMVPCVLPR